MASTQSIGSIELSRIKFMEQDLLDVIDRLRSQGLGKLVALPQLIVCGDQSSGKSSVLEAISGIPFPSNDGLCTVFATEMILRKSDEFTVNVQISPDPDVNATRSDEELKRLLDFGGTYNSSADFESIIDKAKDAMGISKQKTFSNDRLRIEVSGPNLTSLTIVDLPGLFHAGENSAPVQKMVRSYMDNPRSVILAVVSARNDVANQIVLKLTKDVDPTGARTIGIITKPDTLSVGSANESKILTLARNEDPTFVFQHGWHLLRNRSFEEAGTSTQQRDDKEMAFFSQGAWKGVLRIRVGIAALRPRLNSLLLNQIKNELPQLIADIERSIKTHQADLDKLGDSRGTVDEQRTYLIKIASSFQSLTSAAIDGSYSKPFFDNARTRKGYARRFRAVIQNLNKTFAEDMRTKGHFHKIVQTGSIEAAAARKAGPPIFHAMEPITIPRDIYLLRVADLLKKSRGRELPGMFNPMIVSDLFKEQSQSWEKLCQTHVENILKATTEFLEDLVSHLADARVAENLLRSIFDPTLELIFQEMTVKLRSVLLASQEFHPITYNHYFTESLQDIRQSRQSASINSAVLGFLGSKGLSASNNHFEGSFNVQGLVSALSTIKKEPDMDKFASSELIDYMEAFYKVALKTVIDNVAVEVIEGTLVQKLGGIFSPVSVGEMKAASITRIGGEAPDSQAMREALTQALKQLRDGLDICKPFAARGSKVGTRSWRQDKSNESTNSTAATDAPELKSGYTFGSGQAPSTFGISSFFGSSAGSSAPSGAVFGNSSIIGTDGAPAVPWRKDLSGSSG